MQLLAGMFVITMVFFFLLFLGGSILLILSNPWAWGAIVVIAVIKIFHRQIWKDRE